MSSFFSSILKKMLETLQNEIDEYININSTIDTMIAPTSIAGQVVFYISLLLDSPSVLCSFILFYYFIDLPEFRNHRHSKAILTYLLIGSFLVTAIDIPLILPYLKNYHYITSMKYPETFCIFWNIYDYGMYAINLWLVTLTCLERYLLIFFKPFIRTTRRRCFLISHVPVTFVVLFIIAWYLYLIALYPCIQSQFDFTQLFCGYPCYKIASSPTVVMMDWFIANLLPVALTLFFILLLISHVLYQRQKISRHLIQQQTWHRTRKMFHQLLPIAFIFLVFNMPLIVVGMLATSDSWLYTTPYFYANSLSYCQSLFMPFAILSRQNTIRKQLANWLRLRRVNRTAPMTTAAPPPAIRLENVPIT